jgi:phosphotransferase system enzyme I (PtsP)
MVGTGQGPRVLLRRMREVMARPEAAQARLDRIVSLIAANMVAEVCSIYVMRPTGNVLELFASEGLKAEAVHQSTLKTGEGLVGVIAHDAKPLSLSDAQSHPAFKYLPETGEEIYSSFLGVPILRHGVVSGVLVVQNQVKRSYTEEEEEALLTVAMVLAEVIATEDVQQALLPAGGTQALTGSLHIVGEALVDGVGLGHVVLHEPRVIVTNFIAEDAEAERERLDAALDKLHAHVDELADRSPGAGGVDFEDILETVRMFARDRGWQRRLREAVATGLTAEAAVERVQSDTRARLVRQADPYLRERLHDLDDLANRLLRILTGAREKASENELPKDAVIVARTMGPAELLDYPRDSLRGLVLESAGATSHVAIVARAMGLTMVGSATAFPTWWKTVRRSSSMAARARCMCGLRRRCSGLCREGPALCKAAGAVCTAEGQAGGDAGWRADQLVDQCRVCRWTCRIWRQPGHRASGCSGPSCSSCWRGASRGLASSNGSTRVCWTKPVTGRWCSGPWISVLTRCCPT